MAGRFTDAAMEHTVNNSDEKSVRLKFLTQTPVVKFYSAEMGPALEIPVAGSSIKAGFPSPAEDYCELKIDLNRHLIQNPSATFFGRISGDSMREAGIRDGDLIVVDRSLEPRDGAIALCYIDGEFTVKRIRVAKEGLFLLPANTDFNPIPVTPDSQFVVWGIVTYVIHKV